MPSHTGKLTAASGNYVPDSASAKSACLASKALSKLFAHTMIITSILAAILVLITAAVRTNDHKAQKLVTWQGKWQIMLLHMSCYAQVQDLLQSHLQPAGFVESCAGVAGPIGCVSSSVRSITCKSAVR